MSNVLKYLFSHRYMTYCAFKLHVKIFFHQENPIVQYNLLQQIYISFSFTMVNYKICITMCYKLFTSKMEFSIFSTLLAAQKINAIYFRASISNSASVG